MKREIVNVLGLGYIGLPTALMMAAKGAAVVGTDPSEAIIDRLKRGELTFQEEGMDVVFEEAAQNGVAFSTEPVEAEFYIVAVPTPYIDQNKKIDTGYVEKAVEKAVEKCPNHGVIVIESTVSPGTIDSCVRPIVEAGSKRLGKNIHLAHAPERILPGKMIFELENNSRTIGADTVQVAAKVRKLYESFCLGEIVVTDIKTAEMSKVIENTYRDINIAFANELAQICSQASIDVYEVIRIANLHPRVNILNPGPGVGGHCISVDPWFLVGDYPQLTRLISAARQVNEGMPRHVFRRIEEICRNSGITDYGRVGIYGLTYKEDVDDLRESPTLQLLEVMGEKSKEVILYDPMITGGHWPNFAGSLDEFLAKVDMVVVMVGHRQIKKEAGRLAGKIVLDTRKVVEMDGVHRI